MHIGELLREWRQRRRLSQLDLAIQAGVSARHVSFVETGRTVPSSAMVLRLAEHLGVPLRERNRLLVAAGHAPLYRQRLLDDPDMARVWEMLGQFVRGHEPYRARGRPPLEPGPGQRSGRRLLRRRRPGTAAPTGQHDAARPAP